MSSDKKPASGSVSRARPVAGDLVPSEVAHLCRMVRERTGVSLDEDKAYVVHCRLNVLAMSRGLGSPRDIYRKLALNNDDSLAHDVVDTLLTKETSFFRHAHAFHALSEKILPEIEDRRGSVRVWSAGCSTGQEAYCVAMVAQELGLCRHKDRFHIRATDFSEAALEKARSGRYTQLEIGRGLPSEMAGRYFEKRGLEWQANSLLSSLVDFHPHNLLDLSGYGGHYDVVLCRNVLIYFGAAERERVVNNLVASLAPGGYLLLGASECSSRAVHGVRQEQYGNAVFYQRIGENGGAAT